MRKFKVLIIGGGPGGIAASINAASEGLTTLVVDSKEVLGGQAGQSSLLENVIGFPKGISGRDFIKRSVLQSLKFGTEIKHPVVARSIKQVEDGFIVVLSDGDVIHTKVVVLASGLSYTRLQAENLDGFMGRGISYGPTSLRRRGDKLRAFVVGGANSAAQAAMNLAKRGESCEVTMLVRGNGIAETMSDYLLQRIMSAANIHVWTQTTVLEARGGRRLQKLVVQREGQVQVVDADAMQIFIGAAPKTEWLKGLLAMDPRGFIHTGYDLVEKEGLWQLDRRPIPYETSLPGVFSIGDVRTWSTKRVGAAAGEGGAVVARIHEYLLSLTK